MFHYKFVDNFGIIFECDASSLNEAVLLFNQFRNPRCLFKSKYLLYRMAYVYNMENSYYGVTWSPL